MARDRRGHRRPRSARCPGSSPPSTATACRMRVRDSRRIVERTRSRRGTHNERRPFITDVSCSTTSGVYRRAVGARTGVSGPRSGAAPTAADRCGRRRHRGLRARAVSCAARVGRGAHRVRVCPRRRSNACGRPEWHRAGRTTCSASSRWCARRRPVCSPRREAACCAPVAAVRDVEWTEADLRSSTRPTPSSHPAPRTSARRQRRG
jgi:hypothetical protein